MKPIEFLTNIWDYTCQEGDIVFLSTKSQRGTWKDHSLEYRRGIRKHIKEWLIDNPAETNDIYFCPLPFRGKKRRKELVNGVNILWSDIDEGSPKIKPTILWESSPGRLQGLWFLSGDTMHPEDAAELNKSLTYYMDADKGGWDLTQVLRVPGTLNHKYESLPEVRVLDYDLSRTYTKGSIAKRIGKPELRATAPTAEKLGPTFEQIFSKYRRRIPTKVKTLLTQKHVTQGKRSDIIWYLENKLSESGLSAPEIMTCIKASAWNKFKGRGDEDIRLKSEMSSSIPTTRFE